MPETTTKPSSATPGSGLLTTSPEKQATPSPASGQEPTTKKDGSSSTSASTVAVGVGAGVIGVLLLVLFAALVLRARRNRKADHVGQWGGDHSAQSNMMNNPVFVRSAAVTAPEYDELVRRGGEGGGNAPGRASRPQYDHIAVGTRAAEPTTYNTLSGSAGDRALTNSSLSDQQPSFGSADTAYSALSRPDTDAPNRGGEATRDPDHAADAGGLASGYSTPRASPASELHPQASSSQRIAQVANATYGMTLLSGMPSNPDQRDLSV